MLEMPRSGCSHTISVSGSEVRGCLAKGVGFWNCTMISWLQESRKIRKSVKVEGWNLEQI
jgi:hypothetical protein